MMKKMICLGMMCCCLCLMVVEPVLAATDAAVQSPQLLNVNTATLEELEALPGIGPVSAQRILDYRAERGKFNTVDQLVEVKGVGEKSLEKIRSLVTAE